MKGWSKLEEKLNHLIQSCLQLCKRFLFKITPQKSKDLMSKNRLALQEKRKVYYQKITRAKNKLNQARKKVAESTASKVAKAKSIDVKTIKPAHVLAAMTAFIVPFITKLKTWYFTLKPKTIALIAIGGTTASLASLNIYVQSKKIADESAASEQAELVEKLEKANALTRRPTYFKKEEKQFRIESVYLPVYFGNANSMKRLELDFTIQSSNKYIPAYFNKNHHLVKDVLNSEMKPIAVDFPLKEEGKIVVKEKIKKELNNLLRKVKIKGEVTEVYIHSIFGG